MDEEIGYWVGVLITAIITFISCWIYAIVSYGFLLGVGLGWFPSLIVAFIAGLLWPLIAAVIIFALVVAVVVIAYLMIG